MYDNITPPKVNLRFWISKGEMNKLSEIGEKWWKKVLNRLGWINYQTDVETSPIEIVNITAWGRDIDRLKNESEEMFRKRVELALSNAKNSGSVSGLKKIWKNLGLGNLEQYERVGGIDWDIIILKFDEEVFSKFPQLYEAVIKQYGRTCRKYAFRARTNTAVYMRPFSYELSIINSKASE